MYWSPFAPTNSIRLDGRLAYRLRFVARTCCDVLAYFCILASPQIVLALVSVQSGLAHIV